MLPTEEINYKRPKEQERKEYKGDAKGSPKIQRSIQAVAPMQREIWDEEEVVVVDIMGVVAQME
mgnify:CR=1 FL=1